MSAEHDYPRGSASRQTVETFRAADPTRAVETVETDAAHFVVLDGEAMTGPITASTYSATPVKMFPERAEAYWRDGAVTSVIVRGHQMLKSGKPGKADRKAEYRPKRVFSDEFIFADLPPLIAAALNDYADDMGLGAVTK